MKLIIWATVVAVLPFFVFLGEWTNTYENGVLVDRYWVNFAAIFGGLGAVWLAVLALRRAGADEERVWWVSAMALGLIALGVFQMVRGVGVFEWV